MRGAGRVWRVCTFKDQAERVLQRALAHVGEAFNRELDDLIELEVLSAPDGAYLCDNIWSSASYLPPWQ